MKYILHCYLLITFMLSGLRPASALKAQSLDSLDYATASASLQKEPTTIQQGASLKKALHRIRSRFDVAMMYRNGILDDKNVHSTFVLPKTPAEALNKTLKGYQLGFKRTSKQTYSIYRKGRSAMHRQQTVSGTVRDNSSGKVLPGVNIRVQGKATGTTTNKKGVYSLNGPSLQDTLVFSYIGYKSKIVPIDGHTTINVMLTPQAISGQQMVVIGYGKESKQNITGSVSALQSEDIQHSPVTSSTINMLTGKLPGLRVTQRNSTPGGYGNTYDIRGLGNPLIVIDGVPRPNGDLDRINPEAIKSISILKDASAAIYGVRAANGVILVTTKKGGEGEINYKGTYGWSRPINTPDPTNAFQYATLKDEAAVNSGNTPPYSKQELQKFKYGTLPSTDWKSLVMRDYAPKSNQTISATGGNDDIDYYMSLRYLNKQGIWKSGDLSYNRVNIRGNISADVTNNLNVKLLLSGKRGHQEKPGTPTWINMKSIWVQPPTNSAYANNNKNYLNNVFAGNNPIAGTSSKSGYKRHFYKEFTGILKLDYKIPFVNGFQIKGFYSYRTDNNINKNWSKKYALYNYNKTDDEYRPAYIHSPTTLHRFNGENEDNNFQLSLHYKNSFWQNNNIKALLLFEGDKSARTNIYADKEFTLDAVDYLFAGMSDNQQVNSNAPANSAILGFAGRIHYDYQKKYLVTGNFRYDGSSRFAKGHQWGFFPSISAGWRISSEPFIKNNFGFINNLLLRISYGKMGDDAASNFQYLTGYNYPGPNYIFGNKSIQGLGFLSLANPNITWYTAKTLNIGLDGALWNNKLSLSFDVFRRRRNGLLATRNASIPAILGAGLPQVNLNSDENIGGELKLTYKDEKGNFDYGITGNIAITRRKNRHVERSPDLNSYRNWRNNPNNRWADIFWGYQVAGQFQSKKEIKNSPTQGNKGNTNLLPGDYKMQDYNDDGIIDGLDVHPIGYNSNTPEVNFGFNVNIKWKDLNLNALFQGATHFTVVYREQLVEPLPFGGRNSKTFFLDRWHHEDPFDTDSPWVSGKYPPTKLTPQFPSFRYSQNSVRLKDASYLRLKSIELSYTILENIDGIKSLGVFANGFNVLTWTGLDLVDPEHTNATYGYKYPITKNYNLGINIKF